MKKHIITFRFLTTAFIIFGLTLLFYNCEKDETTNFEKSEKNIIEYGISKEDFKKSLTANSIILKLKSSDKNQKKSKENILDELANRLDLENTFYKNENDLVILNSPVLVVGNYKRELLSITKNNKNNSYLLTYPDPTNKKLFYVSDLQGNLLQKVMIQENGEGLIEKFTDSDFQSKSSSSPCDNTIFQTCSSGRHSFENQTAGDCDFWTKPGGTPPSVYTVNGFCPDEDSNNSSLSGGVNGGGSSGYSGSTTGGGIAISPVGGGPGNINTTTTTTTDCIPNLDCPDCNLYGDLNNDCGVEPYESCLTEASVDAILFNQLSSFNKNKIKNFINVNGCNGQTQDFVSEAIKALASDGEVNWEEQIIISNSVPECVKSIINKLINDDAYIDLGDMPTFVKEQLNLSGQIMDVFSNSDKFHLNFKVSNISSNLNASTFFNPTTKAFDIKLNSNYISNATDLAIARTIIHESLHAYISYIYYTQIFSNLRKSLSYILSQNGDDENTSQHIFMVQRFIDNIAQSLGNWDNNSIPNRDYYKYISWSGGMLNTPAFKDLSVEMQTKIKNANINEGNAGIDGKSNKFALGNKNCN